MCGAASVTDSVTDTVTPLVTVTDTVTLTDNATVIVAGPVTRTVTVNALPFPILVCL